MLKAAISWIEETREQSLKKLKTEIQKQISSEQKLCWIKKVLMYFFEKSV